jgi:hypothetical protein
MVTKKYESFLGGLPSIIGLKLQASGCAAPDYCSVISVAREIAKAAECRNEGTCPTAGCESTQGIAQSIDSPVNKAIKNRRSPGFGPRSAERCFEWA